jgi:hypothetical protein
MLVLGKSKKPSLKKNEVKRAGCLAQMIEHLPNKCKTPSSNPSIAKTSLRFPRLLASGWVEVRRK